MRSAKNRGWCRSQVLPFYSEVGPITVGFGVHDIRPVKQVYCAQEVRLAARILIGEKNVGQDITKVSRYALAVVGGTQGSPSRLLVCTRELFRVFSQDGQAALEQAAVSNDETGTTNVFYSGQFNHSAGLNSDGIVSYDTQYSGTARAIVNARADQDAVTIRNLSPDDLDTKVSAAPYHNNGYMVINVASPNGAASAFSYLEPFPQRPS